MYNKEKDFLIWTDDAYYTEDIEEYKKRMTEDCPEAIEGLSDDQIYDLMNDENQDLYFDECSNLDIDLGRPILALLDMGLWDGRKGSFALIKSGNIKSCFAPHCRCMSSNTMYVTEDGEFCQDESHHDGTNHYRYRVFKEGTTEYDISQVEDAIYDGTFTEDMLNYFTRKIGPDIAKVYGWDLKSA